METSTDDAPPKYVCSGISHVHNHEVDEEENLTRAARESLKKEVLSKPFGTDHKKLYYDWYAEYCAGLTQALQTSFVSIFNEYEDMKTTMWRLAFTFNID